MSVDGGMSDNVRTALYGADYSVTLASRAGAGEPMISRVVGKHCESGDVVVMDEYLPADLRPGDLLAVPGTGAYCRALSSQYNHVPVSYTHLDVYKRQNLVILIGQMVNLVKDGAPVRMSKRAGTVVVLEDLVEAVGVDLSLIHI